MRSILNELIYIFCNYFVCNIPIWGIRKILYQMLGMKIGKGSRILMKTVIVNPWKIKIGNHSYINEYCFLDGRGGIEIGENVTIAIYSKLITGYHNIDDNKFSYLKDKIIIEDNVAVFSNSMILAGAILQNGCVISAHSTIKRGTYLKKGVYSGNPARYIRNRNAEEISIENEWKPYFR